MIIHLFKLHKMDYETIAIQHMIWNAEAKLGRINCVIKACRIRTEVSSDNFVQYELNYQLHRRDKLLGTFPAFGMYTCLKSKTTNIKLQ